MKEQSEVEEDLSQAHLRLSRVFIEHLPWQDCIKKYDREHTLFYCDPPYYGTEGLKMESVGIEYSLGSKYGNPAKRSEL